MIYTNDQHNMSAVDDDQGSVYSMDYEQPVGIFAGLPRHQIQDESGLKISYVKGRDREIPKSRLKSPLIYNQIANDINDTKK